MYAVDGYWGSVGVQSVEVYGHVANLPESLGHDFVNVAGETSLYDEGTGIRDVPLDIHPSCGLRLV